MLFAVLLFRVEDDADWLAYLTYGNGYAFSVQLRDKDQIVITRSTARQGARLEKPRFIAPLVVRDESEVILPVPFESRFSLSCVCS